ncbi:hypothetical protein [Hyphomicrobium sp. ghe19]|uniref:hypothetical protein n=1 Tax=Hyphomicrobium sp. ghe19 TaxID=2682968 RepID=UPI00136755FD|nr:hypothetical protein HYPP_02239 [Hyphomicrobium sp. ghe19]
MGVRQSEIAKLTSAFEEQRFTMDGVEAWSARGLMPLFGYESWQNFQSAIDRAVTACTSAGKDASRHFIPVVGDLDITGDRIFNGVIKKSGRGRPPEGMILSRFAAYLVALNGDPTKEAIAFAQVYFAMQTRSMELLEQHLAEVERLEARRQLSQTEKDLSSALYNHGVDDTGFSIIRSRGDEALFGLTTKEMKDRLKCGSAPLANRLPTVIIRAKDLAAEMTAYNTRANKLRGVRPIGDEHVRNNQNVRSALMSSGINPARVEPDEDTAKLERRHKSQHGKVALSAQELPALLPPSEPTPKAAPPVPTKKPTTKEMIKWFVSIYDRAVDRSPSDGGEYAYPLIDIEDVLIGQFPTASDRVIAKAVEELEEEGPWVLAPGADEYYESLER